MKALLLSSLVLAEVANGAESEFARTNGGASDNDFARLATQRLHERGFTNFTEADLRREPRIWFTNMFTVSAALAAAEATKSPLFRAEKRAGAVIFIDECLTRGLTNAMTVEALRSWATNIIAQYRPTNGTQVATKDIPPQLQMLQTNIPTCRFSYADATNTYFSIGPDPKPPSVTVSRVLSGEIESVRISWYIYGIILGPETFSPEWGNGLWYHRKLGDGIYLWHGYK